MRSDSLNKLEDSQLNDSKLNESSASRAKKKKTLKDYEFVINENSKYKTSELGKGAYGTVKKVKDLETGKIFAMKIMNKKAIFEYSNKENLKREISIQRKMHHPHIVRLYTCFEDSENVYLVLEFAENGSLFQYLRKKKTLEENEAFIFFFQTCLGIYYLHRKNVIHRDLKPENLLLDGEGNIKLCDFGWSADNYSKRVTFCGTVDYLAPEMIKNHPHDHRVDIWCLGILLYEMLHGKAPFKGRSDQEKTKNISMNAPIHFDPSLSPEVVELIQKILKPSPIERISMLEIFNHPWMKRHEAVFKIDIKGYIEEQGGQSIQDISVSQSLNDSFGMNTTVEKPNGSSAPSKAKIITIQDTTPLNLPGSTTAIDDKKVRSEPNRDFEKKNEKSRSEAVGSVNIDQFLKDYKIDSTPEMDLLNKVEKFATGGKPSYEPEKAQPFTTDNRSISMPVGSYAGLSKSSSDLSYLNQGSGYGYTAAKIEQKPLTSDYNPYAHQEGESLDQFLRRIRSLGTDPSGTGTSYSTNPFGSGTTGERFSQNTPGMPSYKTETASFGKRSTTPEGYNDDYDMEPQRMSRLSKRNVEIGGLRPSSVNKPKPELNFMEKILVGLGCMTRENPRDNPSKVPRK